MLRLTTVRLAAPAIVGLPRACVGAWARCFAAAAEQPAAAVPVPENVVLDTFDVFNEEPPAVARAQYVDPSKLNLTVPVLSFATREEVGTVALSPRLFGVTPRPDVVHYVLRWKLRLMHPGTNRTKRYADIRGSTRKIYQQKGTGRARHGHIRANIFVGGAKAHGPVVRDKTYRINTKVLDLALRSVVADKFQGGVLTVVDDAVMETPSTLKLADIAKSQGWTDALLVGETRPREETKALHLSARGLEHLDYIQATAIDIYKLLFRKQLVLTRNAVDELTTRLAWV